ncbi:MAG: HEAT repeat domain-containing protein [Chitinispirillia bacterium]|nr:HEAT repeat domain-containing protein [Chitinispirillia bacterium]MCL2268391.1 HEAT repeat domain-containing protein [Chitinispirillia bacterium]
MTKEEALHEIKKPSGVEENMIQAMRLMSKAGTVADIFALMPVATNGATAPAVKKFAVEAICSIIKESLLTRFSELTTEMRQKLATILQTLDPTIIKEISKDLMSNDSERRLSALQMLGILRRHPRVKDLLARLLQDRDPKIKATAVILLGKMMGPHDHQMVITLLGDEDKRVRANTIEALESLGNPRLAPALLKYRKDPSNRIRGNVLKALYNLGHTEIEDDLIDMLNSKEVLNKASALWVITQVKFSKSIKVIDAVGACLLCEDKMVHKNATQALKALESSSLRATGYLRYLGDILEF